MGFLAVERVVTAHEGSIVAGPLHQVLACRPRRSVSVGVVGTKGVQQVVQKLDGRVFGDGASVRPDEGMVEEGDRQWGALVAQKSPGGVRGAEILEDRGVELHRTTIFAGACDRFAVRQRVGPAESSHRREVNTQTARGNGDPVPA